MNGNSVQSFFHCYCHFEANFRSFQSNTTYHSHWILHTQWIETHIKLGLFFSPWLLSRLALFFMPAKYHPPEPYVRRVPVWKMHVFTMVQVAALVVLWAVKSSEFSLAFPFFLIMMVPLRQLMSMFFNSREINAVIYIYLFVLQIVKSAFKIIQSIFNKIFFFPFTCLLFSSSAVFFSIRDVDLLNDGAVLSNGTIKLDGSNPSVDPNDEPDFYQQAMIPA